MAWHDRRQRQRHEPRHPSLDSTWAVLSGHDDLTRVEKRSADGVTWTSVALPTAPPDPLDPQPYTAPTWEVQAFVRVDVLPEEQAPRGSVAVPLLARKVDAAGDEVLVLATAQGEAFVVSTRSRGPVARLPSLAVQRAQVLQTLKPRFATSPKDCRESFLIFPQGTSIVVSERRVARIVTALLTKVSSREALKRWSTWPLVFFMWQVAHVS